jgi:predicted MFS family arabinose efflux permease
LTGLALGNTGLMYASLTETAPRNRVALSLSLVNGSAPMGSLVGALAGGFIVSQYGVHLLFWIDAGVAILIALLLTFFYREDFVRKRTPPLKTMLVDALRAVTSSPVARTIFLVNFIYSAAIYFSFTYLPVRIAQIVGESAAPAAIGIAQGLAGVTTLIGSALWGGLADRIGHRRLLVVLMLTAAFFWLPIYVGQDMTQLTLVWAAFNSVSPAITAIMITIISLNVSDAKRASVLSMIYLPLNLAFIVSPLAASFVARNLEVRDVFLGSAGLSLLALLIFVANVERSRAPQKIATE